MNNMKRNKRLTGVAMVEFAIILPLLLMILYGVTELGRALYQQNILHKGLVAGARYMARAHDIVDVDPVAESCTAAGNYTTVEDNAKNLIVCRQKDDTDNNYCVSSGASPIVPNLTTSDITIELLVNDDEIFGCKIRIEADVQFDSLLLPVTYGENTASSFFNIHAEIEERYIGL
jgi:hypothetical protein